MTDRKLLANLSKLGLQMFEPTEDLDVNQTLAEVVKSHDTRLWEGFPVLLANAADKYRFVPEKVKMGLKNKEEKILFRRLLLISGALYLHYHLSFLWWNKIEKDFTTKEKALIKQWRSRLASNRNLKCNNTELDQERLKRLFELYYEEKAEKDRRRKEKYEEFSLEYALAQVFSPKQKELFKKKLEGLILTKTEREYYSRSVKKKVVALANAELHSLSKKLLGI